MVYAQGGAISSPSTADTDQPTVAMSSATARMQASGSRLIPSASASHSAHWHRCTGGLARRLRDGFMSLTLRGGYDIFGTSRADGYPAAAGGSSPSVPDPAIWSVPETSSVAAAAPAPAAATASAAAASATTAAPAS